MSKYAPLGTYLSNQNRNHIPMTFDEIERILGANLPASKQYPAWWSNSTTNNVMTQQWLDAGYQTQDVKIEMETLVFHRISKVPSATPEKNIKTTTTRRHPMFGCMKGTVTIADGVDMTKPACPEWEHITHDMGIQE